jgi:hypothetical protein
LFLDEKVVGFGASGFEVGVESLLDLVLDVGELGGKRGFAGVEFIVEGEAEFGCSSGDFGVEVATML